MPLNPLSHNKRRKPGKVLWGYLSRNNSRNQSRRLYKT
jgi:hypothetical protein